ncbi:tail tape measure protein [Salmonella enterica subsp. enterica serovar Oranienburg]|uniref:tape measure protein n=1 Tax=Salmonella enterica TaxID=28901 RepID=UPI0009AA47DA|nr:tape measure protein [Salmonella enterica]EBR8190894.1 tail tape measure protein [Salmonella enterica subsp. enterica serovar Oranienburg]HBJ6962343.1 tape measure protein [Salmonella enterica subsp. enterica serovar Duisburg]HCM6288068.1 tape measure protein [Salmonella enterica subsp. enterica serovar -:k:-]EAQ9996076.1 tail tape measure protein [Salmonella enterica]EAR9141730.1 tail tape measure protein [Salmonella enterica]
MKNLKASLIVDLLGNISTKSRQWSQDLGAFSHAGQRGLGGVGTAVRRLGGEAEAGSSRMRQAFRGMRGGIHAVSADLDRLKLSAEGAFGKLTHLYGLLTGGAAVYGFKRLFLDPAAHMESFQTRITSLNHGDASATADTIKWAQKNTQQAPWSLNQILEEYAITRGYGMSDAESRRYVQMLEDQAGRHGWNRQQVEGASLQLREMFARGKLQGQDANQLSGYGINAYQVLAEKLHTTTGAIRKLGEEGKLGPETIRLLFQTLREQASGMAEKSMHTWAGMTMRMQSDWDQFALKVMNGGPFKFLEKQLSGVLDQIAVMQKDGQLDELANDIGQGMLTAFVSATEAVKWLVKQIKAARQALKQLRDDGYGKTLDNIAGGAKTLAKYLLLVYAARTALRMAGAVGMGALRLGATPLRYTLATVGAVTSPFRKRRPVMPGELPGRGGRFMNFLSGVNPAAVQPVFVTNWPAGALAGGGSGGGNTLIEDGGSSKKRRNGRTKKGPGKGRGVSTVVTAGEALAESAAKKGLFGRMASRVGGWFGKIPGLSKAGSLLSAAGNKLGLGKVAGWLGKGSKFLGRFGGGAFGAALLAAPTLLDSQASAHDKGAAVGSGAGAVIGGALGTFAGPVGTVIGSTVGSYLGDYLGGWLTDAYQKITGGNDNNNPPPQKAEARVELVAPPGWDARSIDIDDSDPFGLDMNFYSGGNYVPYG